MYTPKITKEQIIKINTVAAKEIGMDRDLLHNMIEEMTGKKSIRELTKHEAIEVIDRLLNKPVKKQQQSGKASEEQIEKIRALERELGWDSNPKRLQAFIKKYAKTEQLHWLYSHQASNIIEALKKLLKKGYAE